MPGMIRMLSLDPADRRLVFAMVGVAAFLFLPQALVAEQYAVPNQWTSCVADCPQNAFFPLATEPVWLESVLRPLGVLAGCALMLAATGSPSSSGGLSGPAIVGRTRLGT